MTIRIRKPVARELIKLWAEDPLSWENGLSNWMGFEVKLPRFFWEIHLNLSRDRLPTLLTLKCDKKEGWLSVFYEYNLNRDLKKYAEITIIRRCKMIRNNRHDYKQPKHRNYIIDTHMPKSA